MVCLFMQICFHKIKQAFNEYLCRLTEFYFLFFLRETRYNICISQFHCHLRAILLMRAYLPFTLCIRYKKFCSQNVATLRHHHQQTCPFCEKPLRCAHDRVTRLVKRWFNSFFKEMKNLNKKIF